MASKKVRLIYLPSRNVRVGNLQDDQISHLPDAILCHMLSFLPTKYTVRTSVLSNRWKSLFTFVPNLTFKYLNKSKKPHASATSFIEFVNSVFILYNVSHMNKFVLYFDCCPNEPHVRRPVFSWILSVLRRHVKEMKIHIHLDVPRAVPLELFSCKTLTNLSLFGNFKFKLPDSVSLPCLTTCYLGQVWFYDDSARRLFPSCPMLEYLDLVGCHFGEGDKVLDVSSPTLKHFSLAWSEDEPTIEDGYKLVLNVPNLVYFFYSGPPANEFFRLETLNSVVNARIFFHPDSDVPLLGFVRAIRHVRELDISIGTMETFVRAGHPWPTFRNLTTLSVGPVSNLSRFLTDLLDKAPQLKYLKFNYGDDKDNEQADECCWVWPEHVPRCVSRHLTEVDFQHYNRSDYELNLIEYFLKYATNLEKMKINSREKWANHFAFEMSSEACQIVFYVED